MQIGINGASQVAVGASPAAVAAHAAAAEEQWFPSYWVNQGPSPDALTVLAVVAGATATIELGTAVINTWPRHPLMLAAQARTVQEIAGDRLVLTRTGRLLASEVTIRLDPRGAGAADPELALGTMECQVASPTDTPDRADRGDRAR